MTAAFDPRIIQVGISFNGQTTIFQDLNIVATGRKYSTALMNECEARIYNLTNYQKNEILTQASPIKKNLTPIKMFLDVGRESYGTFRIFEGDVITCGSTQPPDIGVVLKSLTNSYFLAHVAGYTQAATTQLSQIAQTIADSNQLTLVFQATDKQINNFSFTGSSAKLIDKLNHIGGINAFVDNNKLIVLDTGKALNNAVRLINAQTGMVGIPELTQYGVRIKMMIDNSIVLYGKVQVDSEVNPAANGEYYITQINYEVATRDNPFWYILECINPAFFLGGTQ